MFTRKLNDISITKENVDQFLDDLEIIHKMSSQFGQDFVELFAEICLIYQVTDENYLSDPFKSSLRNVCVGLLQMLADSLRQVEVIKETHESDMKDGFILTSDEYDSIAACLSRLSISYFTLINLVQTGRYLSLEFIQTIHERFNFLISIEFEGLRSRFKLVECFHSNENIKTLH